MLPGANKHSKRTREVTAGCLSCAAGASIVGACVCVRDHDLCILYMVPLSLCVYNKHTGKEKEKNNIFVVLLTDVCVLYKD